MLFSSYIFIFLFLPLSVAGYFILNRYSMKAAHIFLLLMSFWFYGYFNVSYLFLIVLSIAVNYLFSRAITSIRMKSPDRRMAGLVLAAAVVFNVGLIGYYKYYDFFVSQINAAFKADIPLKEILLPLGISFFTFQQLSFVIDTYKSENALKYGFLEYALYIAFFPQLVAGPIVLHNELVPQLCDESKRRPDADNIFSGICLFGMGLFKKLLIADRLGNAVNWAFDDYASLTAAEIVIIMFAYTFQIYFDFSGYSDMAVGIGRMFNFVLPKNFDSPYKAVSITDFWKRWHLTLTRFLRTYIYFPLGGSRKGKVRTYLNIMTVFLISGIWHGANWTFILWGVMHGLGQCFDRLFERFTGLLPKAVRWAFTFVFVSAAFLLFRSDSVTQWAGFMGRVFSLDGFTVSDTLVQKFFLPETWVIYDTLNLWAFNSHIPNFPILLVLALCLILCLAFKTNYDRKFRPDKKTLVFMTALYTVSIISLGGVSTFLYFNF